jgi:hypothetical protein
MTDFPSSVSARKCLRGEGCGEGLYWVARRTLLINSGLRLAGEKQKTLRKAFAGSLAVQAFVMSWTATHMDEEKASLPSGETALGGNTFEIVGTYLTRSVIVGTGLWLGGDRKNLIRNALVSTAMIQAAVLLWAQGKES